MMQAETYDSSNRPPALVEEFLAVIQYRELLYQFIARSIKTRYKRSFLGIVWTLLNPLLSTIVLALVFSSFFRFDIKNYAIYVLAGLATWNFVSSTTREAMGQMVWSGTLLNRIYVPKSIFVLSAIGANLINLLIFMVAIMVIALFTGAGWHWSMLVWPLSILVVTIFCLGVGLFLAAAGVYFADLLPVYDVILTIWMYATPVWYPVSILPERWLWLFKLNPLFHLIQLLRDPIFLGIVPGWHVWLYGIIAALLAFLVGSLLFTSKSKEYAYRV